ncbi:MAG: phosphatidylserine decarboxylase [Clostridia bacterium]|nr:phosphatidylserine decarboxylase [Clostridia bacterium]
MSKQNTAKKESASLRFLYHTALGRLLLRPLIGRGFSKLGGAFMSSRLSKPLIKRFVRSNNIDLSEYHAESFRCFNDCFTRKIREGYRPIDQGTALIAPSDAFLSAYPITDHAVFPIKQSSYTVSDLLGNDPAAEKFNGGTCLVFRLCVHHYHRYCYVDNGTKGENVFLPGKLHTVRPIALAHCPVFTRNCREYTLMETERYGTVAQIEVGAMLVGKIQNHHGAGPIRKGEEKGMFLYGGSTVVLLLQKGAVELPEALFKATEAGLEIPVTYGATVESAVAQFNA